MEIIKQVPVKQIKKNSLKHLVDKILMKIKNVVECNNNIFVILINRLLSNIIINSFNDVILDNFLLSN